MIVFWVAGEMMRYMAIVAMTDSNQPRSQINLEQTYFYQMLASDRDNDPLTYSLREAPTGMSINATSGLIEWTPNASQIGAQNITTIVSDPFGGIATQSFTIQSSNTEPLNLAPAITSQPNLCGSDRYPLSLSSHSLRSRRNSDHLSPRDQTRWHDNQQCRAD
jgi:hypothetical protein